MNPDRQIITQNTLQHANYYNRDRKKVLSELRRSEAMGDREELIRKVPLGLALERWGEEGEREGIPYRGNSMCRGKMLLIVYTLTSS